ncbi:Protein kinase domain [Dillenia turbinata]|uniref:non-specific serine/threonine protein kinase n=1 Tax=Dillenia turbinata TaxID=194707 RepID=A0AAN8YV96_9MAGN
MEMEIMSPEGTNLRKLFTFTSEQLRTYTTSFSKKLGHGSFGEVYHGILPEGVEVAVKVSRRKATGQLTQEINTLGRIDNKNIIRLFGFCKERNFTALVYEYMPNGSLERFLFDPSKKRLDWGKLEEIAISIAKGIAHIHESGIIHFDIKPDNILLDANFCPKLSDFGIAQCYSADFFYRRGHVEGTRGYIAPELIYYHGHISFPCDVYSFGILLLEIVCGRRNFDFHAGKFFSFSDYSWSRYQKGKLRSVLMDCGIETKDKQKAKRMCLVAFLCLQKTPSTRPSMTDVVKMLEGKAKVCRAQLPFSVLPAHQLPFSVFPAASHRWPRGTLTRAREDFHSCTDIIKIPAICYKEPASNIVKMSSFSYRKNDFAQGTYEIEAVTDSSRPPSPECSFKAMDVLVLSETYDPSVQVPQATQATATMDAVQHDTRAPHIAGDKVISSGGCSVEVDQSIMHFIEGLENDVSATTGGSSSHVVEKSPSRLVDTRGALTDLSTFLGKDLTTLCNDPTLFSRLRRVLLFLSILSEADGIPISIKSVILQIQEEFGPLSIKLQGAQHVINDFEAKVEFEKILKVEIVKYKEMLQHMLTEHVKKQDSLSKLEAKKADYEEQVKALNEKILAIGENISELKSEVTSISQQKDGVVKEVKTLGNQYKQVFSHMSALRGQNQRAKDVVKDVEAKWIGFKQLLEKELC